MSANAEPATLSIAGGLQITEPPLWAADGGTWVMGRIAGHRFEALLDRDGAQDPAEVLGSSRILKLWIQRVRDRRTVFHWFEGSPPVPPDGEVQQIVEVLAAGLAQRVFGE